MIKQFWIGWVWGLCLFVAIGSSGAHTLPAIAGPITVQAVSIPIDPLHPSNNSVGDLTYIGGLVLTSNAPEFGGFSGLEISSDGKQLTAISDRGYWLTADIRAEGAEGAEGNVPKGLDNVRMAPLLTSTKLPVQGSWADAEGLVRSPSGGMLVSFERRHRVWYYPFDVDGFNALPKPVKLPPVVKKIRSNKGLESVAYLDDGRLLMLTEQTFDIRDRLMGWLETPEGFDVIYVKPSGIFHITDMAKLPNGDLLLLERRYTIIGGPGMQIRYISKQDIRPGALLDGRIIASLSSRYNIDNMEGLAVRPGPNGETYLYLISDDNFNEIQRTLLLVFKLP